MMLAEGFSVARKPALGDINRRFHDLFEVLMSNNPDVKRVVQELQNITVDSRDAAEARQHLIQVLLLADAYNIQFLSLPYWRVAVLSLADRLAAAAKDKLAVPAHEHGEGVKRLKL
ncbi:MAG: hypothetical protein QXR17_07730 [Candidatus Bathyarchaeia archaeon]